MDVEKSIQIPRKKPSVGLYSPWIANDKLDCHFIKQIRQWQRPVVIIFHFLPYRKRAATFCWTGEQVVSL
jgi:hypothetical protein